MNLIPREIFLTKGVGRHRERLASYEAALRDAGIAKYNLVYVSSIFPPRCKLSPKKKGLASLKAGQIVPCVLSRCDTNENRRLIAASIGVAIPRGSENYGYLSEHHGYGETDDTAGDYAEDLAASMLATVLGVDFDINASWDERKELWKISGKIVKTKNITQSAIGVRSEFTTVVAAAVLIC